MQKTHYSTRLIPVLILGLTINACKNKDEYIKAEITTITESVYSSAIIRPDSEYTVFSSISGILEQILVQEGDTIQVGTPLFQIKNTVPELNSKNALAALKLAQNNYGQNSPVLSSLKDEIRSAQLRCSNDSINYIRQSSLWSQNIGSKAELDAKKLAFETSRNAVASLRTNYIRRKDELHTQLEQAQNNFALANSNQNDYLIRSKINGLVYRIDKEIGELISPQTTIASLGSADKFTVEMMIDEVDITKLEINQEILINLDAYGSELFKAKVSKIYPQKDERTQTFKVEGVFLEEPPRLFPGLSGEVNILIQQKVGALCLPNEYLNENNEVKTSEGLVKVKTGLRSIDQVEIISGIDSTTKIYSIK